MKYYTQLPLYTHFLTALFYVFCTKYFNISIILKTIHLFKSINLNNFIFMNYNIVKFGNTGFICY